MNEEKLREYFNNRTYPAYKNPAQHYTALAQDTRIYYLLQIENRFSINIDDIITDDNKTLDLFKKLGGNNRAKEVSDLNSFRIAELFNALRHYYRAINNKDFPILSITELNQ